MCYYTEMFPQSYQQLHSLVFNKTRFYKSIISRTKQIYAKTLPVLKVHSE